MATGDQNDMLARLQQLMPRGWFADGMVPIRDGLLIGIANVFAFIFSLLAYVRLQTRIATATDVFLDMIAWDFFGDKLQRQLGETDASFRSEIRALMFRQRCTRNAITLVIQQMLGTTPVIIEPMRVTDTGAYDEPSTLAYDTPGAGCYGDDRMPLQCFVIVTVPRGIVAAPPNVGGYGSSVGGYSTGSQLEYISTQSLIDSVTAANIFSALDSVRPVTGVIWAQLVSA